jgi:hypothetical protein
MPAVSWTSSSTASAAPGDLVVELKIFQSMWGFTGLPWRGVREWTIDERIDAAARAGFDGLSLDDDDPELRGIVSRLVELDMSWCISTFPHSVDDLARTLALAAEIGADHINLQPMPRPATVSEALPLMRGWQELATTSDIPVRFETHRDRLTTDLLFTLQVIDALPDVRLTADLSHYLVGREFRYPVSDENHALIHRIIDRADAYHGRVASREQVQVASEFPQNQKWLDLFMGWWEEGFRRWRARTSEGSVLTFTVELGPPDYAITGADGLELNDRWAEACRLRGLVRALWDRIEQEQIAR